MNDLFCYRLRFSLHSHRFLSDDEASQLRWYVGAKQDFLRHKRDFLAEEAKYRSAAAPIAVRRDLGQYLYWDDFSPIYDPRRREWGSGVPPEAEGRLERQEKVIHDAILFFHRWLKSHGALVPNVAAEWREIAADLPITWRAHITGALAQVLGVP
jgi:hypothetical protein